MALCSSPSEAAKRTPIIRLCAVPPASDSGRLQEIKSEIERFLREHPDALMFEGGSELIHLPSAKYDLTVEFGKLLLTAWDDSRSIVRRVEGAAFRDHGQLGLFVRKPGGKESAVLELRARTQNSSARAAPKDARRASRDDLSAYLQKHFPEWKLERVSNRSDREHSFSVWHTRGVARRGRGAWAFLGLGAAETFAAADAALAYGLNWLDWLRDKSDGLVISGLKLFLPPEALALTALRVSALSRAVGIEIYAWPSAGAPEPLNPGEFMNAATRLVPRADVTAMMARHAPFLRKTFGKFLSRISVVPGGAPNSLSFRVNGLEIARLEGQLSPSFYWGIEGAASGSAEAGGGEFQKFIQAALSLRQARGPDKNSELYRLQPERWLESLIAADLGKIDSNLKAAPVYLQVPAFAGSGRGVVDILGITKEGRLAVIELKLHEDITLPLQGLDYWVRVKWLNDRQEFGKYGYFPGVEISPKPPILYLVSPAFRFHPANEKILRYFDPSVEVIMVGINQQWRDGIKTLFRKRINCEE